MISSYDALAMTWQAAQGRRGCSRLALPQVVGSSTAARRVDRSGDSQQARNGRPEGLWAEYQRRPP